MAYLLPFWGYLAGLKSVSASLFASPTRIRFVSRFALKHVQFSLTNGYTVVFADGSLKVGHIWHIAYYLPLARMWDDVISGFS